VVVSRGLGVIGLPLRYRAPAEVVFATLERA
jgi:predicted MPP superfamily phosphohydrolase